MPRTTWHGAEKRILAMAAAAEAGSEHPVAKALKQAAGAHGIEVPQEVGCEIVLGRGVRAKVGADVVLVGNDDFMDEEGVKTTYFRRAAAEHLESRHTVLYVARNGKLQGMIALANTPQAWNGGCPCPPAARGAAAALPCERRCGTGGQVSCRGHRL